MSNRLLTRRNHLRGGTNGPATLIAPPEEAEETTEVSEFADQIVAAVTPPPPAPCKSEALLIPPPPPVTEAPVKKAKARSRKPVTVTTAPVAPTSQPTNRTAAGLMLLLVVLVVGAVGYFELSYYILIGVAVVLATVGHLLYRRLVAFSTGLTSVGTTAKKLVGQTTAGRMTAYAVTKLRK